MNLYILSQLIQILKNVLQIKILKLTFCFPLKNKQHQIGLERHVGQVVNNYFIMRGELSL